MEFAKAKYEDEAFKIEFSFAMIDKLKSGDANTLAAFKKADSKRIGERTTVRLPYAELGTNSTVEQQVRLYGLCDQKYSWRSKGPHLFGLNKESIAQMVGNSHQDTAYPEQVRSNLSAWKRYIEAKPVFSIQKMPLDTAIESARFDELTVFEKCWVLEAEYRKISSGNFEEISDLLSKFEATLKNKPETFELYKKYIAPPD
jgi:hypothetical protein